MRSHPVILPNTCYVTMGGNARGGRCVPGPRKLKLKRSPFWEPGGARSPAGGRGRGAGAGLRLRGGADAGGTCSCSGSGWRAWPWKDLGLCIPNKDPVLPKLRLLEHPQHPAWDPGIGATAGWLWHAASRLTTPDDRRDAGPPGRWAAWEALSIYG